MLSDTQVRNKQPRDKPFKLTDSGGLYLYITPKGGKLWRFKYMFEGREKLLSIGPYPAISLAEARSARDAAKATLRNHKDPGVEKKVRKLAGVANSAANFESLTRDWFNLQKPQWAARHADDVIHSLERDIFPDLGKLPISDITPQTVLAVLRKVEKRGAKETARRLRQRISAVFVYAISSGVANSDPAAIVTKAMAPLKKGRQPAITNLNAAIEMLRQTEKVPSSVITKLAIRLIALTAVRPGVLATTPWSEFEDIDQDRPLWNVPASRMKLLLKLKDDEARDQIVPLSRQALETIETLKAITGKGPFVFPNGRHAHKPMSENAMGYLLHRAGYHHRHVPHGFRSTFSTIMNERFPADRAVIDFMLAHVPKDKVEVAYNRSDYLDRRIELSQLWADIIMKDAPPAIELVGLPHRGTGRKSKSI